MTVEPPPGLPIHLGRKVAFGFRDAWRGIIRSLAPRVARLLFAPGTQVDYAATHATSVTGGKNALTERDSEGVGMASLDRAYGIRGAAMALGMAAVVGFVHGVMAAAFDHPWVTVPVGIAGAIIMVMAGLISARRSLAGVLGTGFAMGFLFFVVRWAMWALMRGGGALTAGFLTTPPWGWPAWLASAGVDGLWPVEAALLLGPAIFGCYVGMERGRTPA